MTAVLEPSAGYGHEFVRIRRFRVLVLMRVDVVVVMMIVRVVVVIVVLVRVRAVGVRGELAVHPEVQIGQQLEAEQPQQRGPQRERSAPDIVGGSLALRRHGLSIHSTGGRAVVLGTARGGEGITRATDLGGVVEAYGP